MGIRACAAASLRASRPTATASCSGHPLLQCAGCPAAQDLPVVGGWRETLGCEPTRPTGPCHTVFHWPHNATMVIEPPGHEQHEQHEQQSDVKSGSRGGYDFCGLSALTTQRPHAATHYVQSVGLHPRAGVYHGARNPFDKRARSQPETVRAPRSRRHLLARRD
jgi:hypothetical protein